MRIRSSNFRVQVALGLLLVAVFALVWRWQVPGESRRLTPPQVSAYIDRIAAGLPLDARDKGETLARLRAWGEADDGRPVYMLNLMRYHATLQPQPGLEGVRMTPRESNAHYERNAGLLLMKQGGYAQFAGDATGVRDGNGRQRSNLMSFDQEVDEWDRALVIRYPSRRAFFELLSSPEYAPLLPYKLGALGLMLVPLTPEQPMPDFLWPFGLGLLALFCAVGWYRSARRSWFSVAHAPRGGAASRS